MHREYLRLGELLVERALLTKQQVAQALESQRQNRTRFGEIVTTMGWVTEEDLAKALASQFRFDYVDAATIEPDSRALCIVTGRWALAKLILPYGELEDRLQVAISDPLDISSTDEIRFSQSLPLKISVAGPTALRKAIIRHYTLECDSEHPAARPVQTARPTRVDWQADRDALLNALDHLRGNRRGAA